LLTTEEALLSENCDKMQVVACYSDGTVTAANGSTNTWMSFGMNGKKVSLPPNGLFAISGDKNVCVWIGEKNGHRSEFAVAADYAYFNGRGHFTKFTGCSTDGICVRLPISQDIEEIIPFQATRLQLPFKASKIEMLDENYNIIGQQSPIIENGETIIILQPNVVSYRVSRDSFLPSGIKAFESL
jgi:hypothetical protein